MTLRAHLRTFRPGSSRALLVVCLMLAALLAVMQVPHLHRTAVGANRCTLCTVMHSAAPAAVAAPPVVLVQVGVSAAPVKARAVVRYWHPQLFTRPPPLG